MKRTIFRLFCIAVALLCGLSLAACRSSAADTVVAEWKGTKITLEQLFDELDYQFYFSGTEEGLTEQALMEAAAAQLNMLVAYYTALEKAEELGLDSLSGEEQAAILEEVSADLENGRQYYTETLREQNGALSDAQLEALVEAAMQEAGYSEQALCAHYTEAAIYEHIFSYCTDALTLSTDELQAGVSHLAEQARETYATDPDRYDYDQLLDATIYYTPAHVRRIKHILIALTEEDAEAVSAAYAAENTEEGDALLAEALEHIHGEAEEVYARVQLDPGKFDEILQELTDDPEAADNPDGYFVRESSAMYSPAFLEAAFALQTEGELSGLIATSSGYHILRLEEIVPEGPTDLEDVADAAYETLLQQKKEAAFQENIRAWQEGISIRTYPSRYKAAVKERYIELLS